MATAVKAQYTDLNFATQEARSASLGGCFLATDYPLGNPAAMPKGLFVVGSVDSRFLVSGLTTKRLGMGMPLRQGMAATVAYAHFGDATYSEQQASASMGMRIGSKWRIGVRFDYAYRGYADAHYLSTHSIGGGVGIGGKLTDQMEVGTLVAYLPLHPTPYAAAAGMAYSPLTHFRLMADVGWHTGWEYHAGAEYCYAEWLYVRMGFSSPPHTLCFGVGLRFGNISIDMAASSHPLLGYSPQISLGLWW